MTRAMGVDHSPASLSALRYAAQAAHLHEATLVPLFVHDTHLTSASMLDLAVLEDAEREALRTAATAAGATTTKVEPEVLTGHAADALLAAADPADLLVVGSRGRGGFAGLLLGSTSTQVAQHTSCPVVIVRGA
jgi:nucleotide-binding universal stress UspA family protein